MRAILLAIACAVVMLAGCEQKANKPEANAAPAAKVKAISTETTATK